MSDLPRVAMNRIFNTRHSLGPINQPGLVVSPGYAATGPRALGLAAGRWPSPVPFKIAVTIAAACSFSLVACRKEPKPEPVETIAKKVSIADADGSPAAPVPPLGAASEPVDPAEAKPDSTADLRRLTKALKDYVAAKGKLPVNVDELSTAGFVSSIPGAPQGMHWDFDRKKVEVVVVGYPVGL